MAVTQPGLLLFRADAGPDLGGGHVMRCLALAQAWQDLDGTALLLASRLPKPLAERWEAEGFAVEPLSAAPGSAGDRRATAERATKLGACWIVLDGYGFDHAFTAALRDRGRVARIADDALIKVAEEVIVNPNLHASTALYPRRRAGSRFYLGPRYALLRREFLQPVEERAAVRAQRLLITLGASDALALTLPVAAAIAGLERSDLSVRVVLGSAGAAAPDLAGRIEALLPRCRVIQSADNMAEQMDWSDAAVAAAGGTSWELLHRGVPSLLVPVADNQGPVAREIGLRGASLVALPNEVVDPEHLAPLLSTLLDDENERHRLAERGRSLVDGNGARRLAGALAVPSLGVRRAIDTDADLLFRWANDPITRRASFGQTAISWSDHRRWLDQRLRDSRCPLVVAPVEGGDPIGTVRFDPTGRGSTISVNLAPQVRGRGWGAAVIAAGLAARAAAPAPPSRIDAYIRPSNAASLAAFSQAGFEPEGTAVVGGTEVLHLTFPLARTLESSSSPAVQPVTMSTL